MVWRNCLVIGLLVPILLLSFGLSNAQVPHTVIGQVFNSDATVPTVGELSFQAYIVDVSNNNAHSETRTEEDPGNAYGNGIMGPGWIEVECGNFTALDWSGGDSLAIHFSNSANGEVGFVAVLLTADQEPQMAEDITLTEPTPAWSLTQDDDPDPVWAGSNVTYTISYHNTGEGTATSVTIVDTIPTHTAYLSNTGGGSYDGQLVTWSPGSIPPGDSGNVSLTLTVGSPLPNGTIIANTAHIACSQGSGASTFQSTTVQAAPAWTFGLSDSPDPTDAGDFLTYTISYQNAGSDQATGVTIVDTIPAHTAYSSNTGGGSYDGQRVTWSPGSLSAGSSGSVTLTVLIDWPLPNGTYIENAAHITCDQGVEASGSQNTQVNPDTFPPDPVFDLIAASMGDEVHLSWSPTLLDIYGNPEAVDSYIVYRNEIPYFAPTSTDSLVIVSDTLLVDGGGEAGSPGGSVFYVLRGVDHTGNISDNSNRAGKLDYSLPYASAGYTMISLSLDDGVTTLARELGAKVPNCSAVKVWDAGERGYASRAFKVDDTWYGSESITLGYPYYLFISSPGDSVWTLAGQVPADPNFDLLAPTGNDYNTITLPLSSNITLAKDLGADIPYCTAVKQWDEKNQGYVSIAFKVGETWYGDTIVKRGSPYYVNVTQNSTWPSAKKDLVRTTVHHRS